MHGPLPSLPQPRVPRPVRGRREEATLLSDSELALSPAHAPSPRHIAYRRAREPSPHGNANARQCDASADVSADTILLCAVSNVDPDEGRALLLFAPVATRETGVGR